MTNASRASQPSHTGPGARRGSGRAPVARGLPLAVALALGCTSPPTVISTGEDGSPCDSNEICNSGRCVTSIGMCTEGRSGSPCATASDCTSSRCVVALNECTDGREGNPCSSDEDCTVGCVVADQECTGGWDACDDDGDCLGSSICSSSGSCVRGCRSDCDCYTSSEFCHTPSGGGDWYCTSSSSGGTCAADDVGTACSSPSTCSDIRGGYCSTGGFCTAECDTHWDCGCPVSAGDADVNANRCSVGCVPIEGSRYCLATCETDADCPSGTPRCLSLAGWSVRFCGQ